MNKSARWRLLLGAAFLMATSSIGPGFLTQTTVFTNDLMASFAFAILVSIIIDVIVQLNVWRIIAVTEKRAQDIANLLLPGLGYCVAFLIVLGGLIFNIANIGGAALGMDVVFSINPYIGAIVSALFAIIIFVSKDADKVIDYLMLALGTLMIGLTSYVFILSSPPIAEAARQAILPDKIDLIIIVTLVGGTVGGYITYAGGHHLLESGIKGEQALPDVNKSALTAITVASLMRVLFFLATLGVISKGLSLDPQNPPASVFRLAAGEIGYKFFGVVMWCAAITSIIGSAYTSISFIRSFHHWIEKNHTLIVIVFILVSTVGFALIGQPVKALIYAGALNGLILPITLGVMLIAAHKSTIVGTYRHSLLLTWMGFIVVIIMALMGIYTIINLSAFHL